MKCSAQSLLRWLLEVPLSETGRVSNCTLRFSAAPDKLAKANGLTISLVLKRIPAMVNLQWGSARASRGVINMNARGLAPDDGTQSTTIGDRLHILLGFFPVLDDLARKVSADCLCPDCIDKTRPAQGSLRTGCLRRTAVDEALLLLAHGIADGFGVNDVSSVFEIEPIVEGMVVLLLELMTEQKVSWDTWFMVSSCVYLGCPFEKPPLGENPLLDNVEGATSFAAVQFGNLATSAPWLDLTQELAVQGCFGLVASKGRFGTVTKSDHQQMQFRAVEENFAIIEIEPTEVAGLFTAKYEKAPSSVDHRFRPDDDESAVESDVILFQTDNRFYRLLLRIKTKNHWQVVDPSAALTALIQMPPSSASCQHGVHPPEMAPSTARVYTMDEVLGRWPDNLRAHGSPDGVGTYYLTCVLDTHLKKNVALALSLRSTAVLNFPELACLPCTLRHAGEVETGVVYYEEDSEVDVTSQNRYIISPRAQLAERPRALRLGSSVDDGAGLP